MRLRADLRVTDRDVDVQLDVASGRTLALLGPNGAGKSTVLACLAGLMHPDAAVVTLGERTLCATGDGADAWVPPHRRGIALLAQEARLFPHLSVVDNIAFGPRSTGSPRAAARALAARWLDEVGLTDLADRRPHQLSGGQAQRVAIARALATDPSLLLLDEPLAALDVQVAPSVRQLLRTVLKARTTIVVTHDVLDAVLLADDVAVIEDGRIVESGPTAQVLSRPTSAFAARTAGLNLVRGTAEGSGIRTAAGLRVEGLPDDTLQEGRPAVAVFSPNAVSVFREAPSGSPRNVIAARVTDLEPHGHQIRVHTEAMTAEVTPGAVADLDLAPGHEVVLTVKASEVAVYPI